MAATQEVIVKKSREEWAQIINADWRKSIEGIIQTGRDLVQAKIDLPNGQFGSMIREDLDFGIETARRLRRIAEHPKIGESTTGWPLPISWCVLSELSKLSAEDFEWAQERGLIDDATSVRKAHALHGALNTPPGQVVHPDRTPAELPRPTEARDIARETGRFVAASDGNIYSGATDEEGADADRRREQTYGARDAIELLAATKPPEQWLAEAETWWLHEFSIDDVRRARDWISQLLVAMEARDGK